MPDQTQIPEIDENAEALSGHPNRIASTQEIRQQTPPAQQAQ